MSVEKIFPVLSLSRNDLQRAYFTEEEAKIFTDQEMVQIAEELRFGFTVDPGFWYTLEIISRRVLSERELLVEEEGLHRAYFATWMETIDQHVWQLAGCSVHDLPDYDFHAMFDDGQEPGEVVNNILQEAGLTI